MVKSSLKKQFNVSNKELEILNLLKENEEGLRSKTLIRLTQLNKRNLYKKLNSLKSKNLIINIFPIWKIIKKGVNYIQGKALISSQLLESNNKFQLHDLSFVIHLLDKPIWWEKRNNKLLRFKFDHIKNIMWGNNPYSQILYDNCIIQMFSNSLIIMVRKKYYGLDPYDCFIEGCKDFLDCLNNLEERLNFKFFKDNIPQISVRTHNYVRLRDAIAKKCKENNSKFEIYIGNQLRLYVDMSLPLGMEAGHKNFAPEDINLYNKHISDWLKNNPPTNSELAQISKDTLEGINTLSKSESFNREQISAFNRNFETHVLVLTKLGTAVDTLEKSVNNLNKATRKKPINIRPKLNQQNLNKYFK